MLAACDKQRCDSNLIDSVQFALQLWVPRRNPPYIENDVDTHTVCESQHSRPGLSVSHILCPFEAATWLSISSHDGCSHGATAAGSPAAAAPGIGGASPSALADQALASASVGGRRSAALGGATLTMVTSSRCMRSEMGWRELPSSCRQSMCGSGGCAVAAGTGSKKASRPPTLGLGQGLGLELGSGLGLGLGLELTLGLGLGLGRP